MDDHSRPYLLAWRLEGRKVVVVGGGSIGTAKVETLLDTGARIVVIDPAPSTRLDDLASQGRVQLIRRKARPTDMVRAALVVAATGDSKANRRLRRWVKPCGAVANAAEAGCPFPSPTVMVVGPVAAGSLADVVPAGTMAECEPWFSEQIEHRSPSTVRS